jgi:tetraacyldisaccharide 4'-kinase
MVLAPAAALYAAAARHKLVYAPREKVDAPVLCIGNFTVGGSGKTPVAIALARQAQAMGRKPGILSRGHGGKLRRPRIVDPVLDNARDVGDEPLLLAAHAAVAVTPDRASGARLLIAEGCDFLIMDDGFQSARIAIDYALIVVDARYGIGNGWVLPAGPLRAGLVDQLRYADALLSMGEGVGSDSVIRAASRAGRPVYKATAEPRDAQRYAGMRVLAFAGIGHPGKFFETLREAGARVVVARSYPDHHFYSADDLRGLMAAARSDRLELVTTAKDVARLQEAFMPTGFAKALNVLEIDAVFKDEDAASRIIKDTLSAWRNRRN